MSDAAHRNLCERAIAFYNQKINTIVRTTIGWAIYAMVALGYRDAGWEYVALDDCWQAPERVKGRVVADPKRFPSGMRALGDYIHARGLK